MIRLTFVNTRKQSTPRWDSIQTMLRDMVEDEGATLVRIARVDGGCNYRVDGVYSCDLRTNGDLIEVTVTIEQPMI